MALLVCKECGQSYSNSLDTCPHCGYSPKYYSCPECGNPYTPLDSVCLHCGIQLENAERILAKDDSVLACYESYKENLNKTQTANGWYALARFFSNLQGIEDSASLFEYCQMKASEAKNHEKQDAVCQQTRQLLEKKDYSSVELEKCIAELKEVNNSEESKQLMVKCLEALRLCRYTEAVKLENSSSDDIDALHEAAERYAAMSGYKDSKQRFEACNKRIKALQTKKRLRIVFPIVGGVVALVALALFLWRGPIFYKLGSSAFSRENFKLSARLFGVAGTYRDAPYCKEEALMAEAYYEGKEAFSAGDYKLAIQKFQDAGPYLDSSEQLHIAEIHDYYSDGLLAVDAKDYRAAIELFTKAGSFSDAQEKLKQSLYSQGEVYCSVGDYDEAIAVYDSIKEYSDSAEQRKKCFYLKGVACQNSGNKEEAVDCFNNCADYKDTGSLLESIGEAAIEEKNYELAQKAYKLIGSQEGKSKYSYVSGILYLKEKKYSEAMNALSECLGAKAVYDSVDKYHEASYLLAESLFSSHDYASAKKYFATADTYSDAESMQIACDFMIAETAYKNGELNTAKNGFEKLPSDYSYQSVSVADRLKTLSKYSTYVSMCGVWSITSSKMEVWQYWNYNWSGDSWYRESCDRTELTITCKIQEDGKVLIAGNFSMTKYTNYSSLSAYLKERTDKITFSKEVSSVPYDLEIRTNYKLTFSGGKFTIDYYNKDNNSSQNFTYIYKTKHVYGTKKKSI